MILFDSNIKQVDEDDTLVTPKQSTSKMQKELFPNEHGILIKTEDHDDTDDKKQSVNTPTAKKSLLNGPRTPTPFKNALNEIRKIHGQTYVPSSPNGLVEDITEIMEKERQQDSTMDSVYETDSSAIAQTAQQDNDANASVSNPKRLTYEEADSNQQQQKKAKKSLESTWNTTTTATTEESDEFPYLVETPVSFSIWFINYNLQTSFNKEKKMNFDLIIPVI